MKQVNTTIKKVKVNAKNAVKAKHPCLKVQKVHEIIRKSMLTGVIIYLQTRPTIQATVAIMISSIAIATLNYFEPQKIRVIFWLAQLSFIITNLK